MLHLGNHATRRRLTGSPIKKTLVPHDGFMFRTTHRPNEQLCSVLQQAVIGRNPNRALHTPLFPGCPLSFPPAYMLSCVQSTLSDRRRPRCKLLRSWRFRLATGSDRCPHRFIHDQRNRIGRGKFLKLPPSDFVRTVVDDQNLADLAGHGIEAAVNRRTNAVGDDDRADPRGVGRIDGLGIGLQFAQHTVAQNPFTQSATYSACSELRAGKIGSDSTLCAAHSVKDKSQHRCLISPIAG